MKNRIKKKCMIYWNSGYLNPLEGIRISVAGALMSGENKDEDDEKLV